MESNKHSQNIGVKIIKSDADSTPFSVFTDRKVIEKSDKSEQLSRENSVSASEWISHPVDMRGLKELVSDSTILPQCIKAYKNNIAGFGLSVHYLSDYDEETEEMKAEWTKMEEIIALLNMDMMAKEVFENVIRDRETYGIAYCEVIRDFNGDVVQLEFIIDTPSVDMTYPLEPYMDVEYYYNGKVIYRKKKFRKFRQNIAGKTVYFKEFGDPRIMDKRDGTYLEEGEKVIEYDNQANEIIEFRIGSMPYGEVRWIGQVLTVDGNRRAEVLNNNYFREGRHTPLMIVVKGGTLSDESFDKLKSYMNEIKGEKGQHAFVVLETESNENSAAFDGEKQADIEIKDLASILQKDELFQEYQENGRKKTQSSFLLPDLYTGYTTDFNRATAQTAMEVTEKQVFQPERTSLAWTVNNRLLNGYRFQYVGVKFDDPDITNPDDIQKILNITERAGGLTPNLAKEVTYNTLGKDGCEDYEGDWGDVPLQYMKASMETRTDEGSRQVMKVSDGELKQMDEQIGKAQGNHDTEVVAVMREIRKMLIEMEGACA